MNRVRGEWVGSRYSGGLVLPQAHTSPSRPNPLGLEALQKLTPRKITQNRAAPACGLCRTPHAGLGAPEGRPGLLLMAPPTEPSILSEGTVGGGTDRKLHDFLHVCYAV